MSSAAGQLCSAEAAANPVAVTRAAFHAPLPLGVPAPSAVVACAVQPTSGAVVVSSRALPTAQGSALHMSAQLHQLRATSATAEASETSVTAEATETSGNKLAGALASAAPRAAPVHHAFACLWAEPHRHSGFWVHPAQADAAVQLAAAAVPASGNSAAPLVSVAVGTYAPLGLGAEAAPVAGASAAPTAAGGLDCTHWIAGNSSGPALLVERNELRTLT